MNPSPTHTVRDCDHWIFDMDGTLTFAIHDFDAIRKELNLPTGVPILEAISKLPPDAARHTSQKLDKLEYEIAELATQQPGAEALLTKLNSRGTQIGILTRNGHGIAMATLKACGLDQFFTSTTVVSRDCCTPKPDAAGVNKLLVQWSAEPSRTVMVGDYLFDLQAGTNAGVNTVHLDVNQQFPWPDLTTLEVTSLHELTTLL